MPDDCQGEPSILQKIHHDIILVIADHLAACDSYGTISSLSMTAPKLKQVLQPYLEQEKKGIWMRLEDWNWNELEASGMQKYTKIG